MAKLANLPVRAKARRFKALLPIIERKIAEGVHHKDIIEALAEEGLVLPENTYFTYLRRYRKAGAQATMRPAPAGPLNAFASTRSRAQSPLAEAVDDEADRPPRFEYNPRGNPDLLK
jgi:hypothetical protein